VCAHTRAVCQCIVSDDVTGFMFTHVGRVDPECVTVAWPAGMSDECHLLLSVSSILLCLGQLCFLHTAQHFSRLACCELTLLLTCYTKYML
jgi:hypothetical protein